MSNAELLPEEYQEEAGSYVRGTDTMDVWFDSGVQILYISDHKFTCLIWVHLHA